MATAPTIYQKKLAARRASADIERLAKTYQAGLFDVTQEQQNAFTSWQKKSQDLMAPYEASVQKYTSVDFPKYQESLAGYQSTMDAYKAQADAYRARLDAFNRSILDLEANPSELVSSEWLGGRMQEIVIEGKLYSLTGYKGRNVPGEYEVKKDGKKYTVYKDKPIPTFTEQPPAAPSVPVPNAPTPPGAPPEIPALDTSEFAKKREQLGKTFQREVSERNAAKQNVVMRRMNRGMLRGG